MRTVVVGAAALLAVAGTARAQGAAGQEQQQQQEQQQATSDAFLRACVDLMNGRVPEGGEKAITALRSGCEGLMRARADERIQAEQQRKAQQEARRQQQASVQPGQGRGQPQQGQGVLAAFEQAGRELTGDRRMAAIGMKQGGGAISNTLLSNPVGWFNGIGINAELFHSFAPRLSWVGGARYSTTDASNGNASTFGVMAGVDLFAIGRNNEGLRIGPRLELAAGRETFQGTTSYGRMGLSGELGYNFIASNGITGVLAGGFGGRIAGDSKNESYESFTGGELGPYLKLGIGFSW